MMEKKGLSCYSLKGNLCYTPNKDEFCIIENGYVVCKDGDVPEYMRHYQRNIKIFPVWIMEIDSFCQVWWTCMCMHLSMLFAELEWI